MAATTTYDFESFIVGSSFSGVSGEFQVQTLTGDPLRIDDRSGTFSPSLSGLGGNVLAEVPEGLSIPDFEFVFDTPIDYFEIYVLDAEESFQVTSDTGLTASITAFGREAGLIRSAEDYCAEIRDSTTRRQAIAPDPA